jgi:hypothetical protein
LAAGVEVAKEKAPTLEDIEAATVALYMAQLADEKCPAHLKLGAAKALDAHVQARRAEAGRGAAEAPPEEDGSVDPMTDLDEVSERRRKRATGVR